MYNSDIDIVIISAAKTGALECLTRQAIETAGNHNFIIIESNRDVSYDYKNTITIYPKVTFGYNKYLNIGARAGKSKYIFFANNDLIFKDDWDKEILKAMSKEQSPSASPICANTHKEFNIKLNSGNYRGYEIRRFFCGWAFMWTRKLFEEVGGFDEDFIFWCADNAVVEQLKQTGSPHILATSSIVNHIKNITRDTLSKDVFDQYTKGELNKFNIKYNQNIEVPGF